MVTSHRWESWGQRRAWSPGNLTARGHLLYPVLAISTGLGSPQITSQCFLFCGRGKRSPQGALLWLRAGSLLGSQFCSQQSQSFQISNQPRQESLVWPHLGLKKNPEPALFICCLLPVSCGKILTEIPGITAVAVKKKKKKKEIPERLYPWSEELCCLYPWERTDTHKCLRTWRAAKMVIRKSENS